MRGTGLLGTSVPITMTQDTEELLMNRSRPRGQLSMPTVPNLSPKINAEDDLASWRTLAPDIMTPNLQETVDMFRRSMSFSILQEMSGRPPAEVRRSIQNKLWRPKDEEMRLPTDWERLLVYVVRAGGRAFMLSYGLRSVTSFLLTLIKVMRSRHPLDRRALKAAFVGEDTTRFALMFGLWVTIYKFVNNALRLLSSFHKTAPSQPGLRRTLTQPSLHKMDEGEEGLTMKRTFQSEKREKRTRFEHLLACDSRARNWHPYAAGAVSALALLVGKQSLVQSFVPQLFVRGLEGTYRHARANGWINIPYGNVLVFGFANIMIITTWLGAPRYLSRGYKVWMDKASNVPLPAINMAEQAANNSAISPWALLDLYGGTIPNPVSENPLVFPDEPPNKHARFGISGEVTAKLQRWFEHGDSNCYPSCAISHPYSTNHWIVSLRNFYDAWRFVIPVYLTLYFVPTLFLRTRSLFFTPRQTILRILIGAARSSAFLGMYALIMKTGFCTLHSMSDAITYSPRLSKSRIMKRVAAILGDNRLKAVPGFLTCLSLFVEHKKRRSELTAYVLPKALECMWGQGRDLGIFPHVPAGNLVLACISLSMIMGTYAHHPESLSGLVSLVLYQFVGRN